MPSRCGFLPSSCGFSRWHYGMRMCVYSLRREAPDVHRLCFAAEPSWPGTLNLLLRMRRLRLPASATDIQAVLSGWIAWLDCRECWQYASSPVPVLEIASFRLILHGNSKERNRAEFSAYQAHGALSVRILNRMHQGPKECEAASPWASWEGRPWPYRLID